MGKIQVAGIGCGTIAGTAHIPSHIDPVINTARMMQAIYDSSDAREEIKLEWYRGMKCIPKGKVTEAFPLYFKFGFIEKIQDTR